MLDRRQFLRAALMLGLSSPTLAQTWPGQKRKLGPSILVTVAAPKEDPDYYVGTSPGFQNVTIYSPNLELFGGRVFEAAQTEPKTYRATLEGIWVYVYING